MNAYDIPGTVFKNGSVSLLARVVGADGQPIVQADITSAKYTASLLDLNDPDKSTPITGHTDVSVDVASLIYNTLQQDDLWYVDDIGYSFLHILDVVTNPVFTLAARDYRIEFRLTPTSGQAIIVRFRLHAI